MDPTQAWRDGDLVVVTGDGALPRNCLKCGASVADGSRLICRSLQHTSQSKLNLGQQLTVLVILGLAANGAAFFVGRGIQGILQSTSLINAVAPVSLIGLGLILVGTFLYLLGRLKPLQKSRQMRVSIGVFRCERHQRQLSILRALNYVILVCCLGVSSIYLAKPEIILFRILPLLFGLIFANTIVYSRLSGRLQLVRQAESHSWLSGFGKPFVDSLPPYPHAAERSSPAMAPSSQPL
jgi:hypothetical protein